MEDQPHLKSVAVSYFQELFALKDGVYEQVIDSLHRCISDIDNVELIKPFEKEEFRCALMQTDSDKTLGPDGFNPGFYKLFWEDFEDEVVLTRCSWLDSGTLPTSLNDTNIALIPKKDNLESMLDWRPISFCTLQYKLVTKVLANHLKVVLHKCIFIEQSTFVYDRSILDNKGRFHSKLT